MAVGAPGGFDSTDIDPFAARFEKQEQWDDFSMFYGGVQAVSLNPEGGQFDGAGDPRRGGVYVTV